jgi:hypothetical protein
MAAKMLKNFYKKKISYSIGENGLLLGVFFKLNKSRGIGDHRTERATRCSTVHVPRILEGTENMRYFPS